MTEQEALARQDPDWALIRALYLKAEWLQTVIARLAAEASPEAKAQIWEDGFNASQGQHSLQQADPKHPFTRSNPHRES